MKKQLDPMCRVQTRNHILRWMFILFFNPIVFVISTSLIVSTNEPPEIKFLYLFIVSVFVIFTKALILGEFNKEKIFYDITFRTLISLMIAFGVFFLIINNLSIESDIILYNSVENLLIVNMTVLGIYMSIYLVVVLLSLIITLLFNKITVNSKK